MEVGAQIFEAQVMHKRLFPEENAFRYGVYYVALPIDALNTPDVAQHLAVDRRATMSFQTKDHGAKSGDNLEGWIRDILAQHDLNDCVQHIVLICMPRLFGYVFNPVSFWMCLDAQQALRAVLCEVNNTFGETHSYLCAHADKSVISGDDVMHAEKLFHVSPFLEREGHYQFRFSSAKNKLGIWIDFYDAQGKQKLLTSLVGELSPLSKTALRRAFWRYPLVTLKTIGLIHYQAIRLAMKGVRYINKPIQKTIRLSNTQEKAGV